MPTPPAFDAPVMGSSSEKLEWFGYPTVKKVRRYGYSFWQQWRTCRTDRQTNRQTPHDAAASSFSNQLETWFCVLKCLHMRLEHITLQ